MNFFKLIILINSFCNIFGYNIVPSKFHHEKKSIIFFPAKLKDNMPNELYSNFLYKLGEKYNIYISKSNIKENIKLIKEITEKKEDICIISHSSSANDVLELSNDIKLDKLVLIDPIEFKKKKNDVDNPFNNFIINADEIDTNINNFLEADKIKMIKDTIWKKKEKIEDNINANNISNILILKNKISDKWRFIPPVPPINYLSIDIDDIKSDNKNITNLDYFGHFDILDSPWANLAHKTISKGTLNRDNNNIEDYHSYLVDLINDFNI